MKALKKTIIEFILLGMVGLIIGFTANGLRTKNSLQFTKNYFDFGTVITIPNNGDSDAVATNNSKYPKHRYQEMKYDEVLALLNDPNTEMGLNAFVDARNDDNYSEGHIPGAYQCDPYNVSLYIDDIIDNLLGAEKVVVYCGGGECVDSIIMCRELVEMDVPLEAVYLFAGGWSEWVKNDSPVETGSREIINDESELEESSSSESGYEE